jgi:hypothetical protein
VQPSRSGSRPRVAHERACQASYDQRRVRCHVGCDGGDLVMRVHGEVRNAAAVVAEPLEGVGQRVLGGAVKNLLDAGVSLGVACRRTYRQSST